MSDENLAEGLNESYRQHQREVVIKHLTDPKRRSLTMGQIAKLVGHEEHGEVVASITLAELLEHQGDGGDRPSSPKPKAAKKSSGSGGKKGASKPANPPKKAASAKKATSKKTTSKKTSAPKKASAPKKKASAPKGPKADKGKPKPRLDYDQGKREIMAALKAAKAQGHDSLGRSALEEATGFTGVQVRTFCKKLSEEGKVNILGEGGRSTTYALS